MNSSHHLVTASSAIISGSSTCSSSHCSDRIPMTKSRGRSSSNMMYIADLQMYTHSVFSSQFPFICFVDHFDQLFRLLVFSRLALISSSLGKQCSSNLFFTILHEINDHVYRLLSQHETISTTLVRIRLSNIAWKYSVRSSLLFLEKEFFLCISVHTNILCLYQYSSTLYFLLCTTLFLCHVLYPLPRPEP